MRCACAVLLLLCVSWAQDPAVPQSDAPVPPKETDLKQRKLALEESPRVQALVKVMAGLSGKAQAKKADRARLAAALRALSLGPRYPDPALVFILAEDLAEVLTLGEMSEFEYQQLAERLDSVMNTASLPDEEVLLDIWGANAILETSDAPFELVSRLVSDMKAIYFQAQRQPDLETHGTVVPHARRH